MNKDMARIKIFLDVGVGSPKNLLPVLSQEATKGHGSA